MWWPAIGGLIIGLGGLIFPQALGVGYDTIGSLLQGSVPAQMILGILLVKSIIWAVSLGSGTSGGVLAPLLMMGGALGGLEAFILPNMGLGFWPLVSMGAILGGTMRSPFTGILFALELTHDINMLLPLVVSVFIAHSFTVLSLRRSILTEKVARRGFHLSREYAVDPLEILAVREVMRTNVIALPAGMPLPRLTENAIVDADGARLSRGQHLYPVIDDLGILQGVVTRQDLLKMAGENTGSSIETTLVDVVNHDPIVAYPDEPLRAVVYRMAESGRTRFPVVSREGGPKLQGMVSLNDLLKARERNLAEERTRERVLRLKILRFTTPNAVEPAEKELTKR
jgi:CIC family chloride channel protein